MSFRNNMYPLLRDILTASQHNRFGKTVERKLLLGTIYAFAGITFFLLFSVIFLYRGQLFHGLTLICFATYLLLCYLYVWATGNYNRAFLMGVYMMVLFSGYMVYRGGAQMSGPLWSFFVPLVSTYLLGLKRGFISVSILFTVIGIIFFTPWMTPAGASYTSIYKFRFLSSLSLVCLMAFTYEYSRNLAHKELVALSGRLDRAARTDELTGLSNRRDMKEKLRYESRRSARSQKPFCLMLVDIDNFKQVNDTYGHDSGDLTLQATSRIMQAMLRKQDVISRWGGEEFLMLLPETNMAEGRNTAGRLLEEIAGQHFSIGEKSLSLTVSIGLTQCKPTDDLERAITKADQALYRAKENGKNQVATN